jgi:hemoglobin
MLTRKSILALALLINLLVPAAAVPQESGAQQPSLYNRLGGYDAIAAITDDVFGHAVADPQLARFFKGHSVDTQKRQRQNAVTFICAAAGGPCVYIGRDMKTTHTGLGITEADWAVLMKYLASTLDKFKVQEREKSELLSLMAGLKGDIVGR